MENILSELLKRRHSLCIYRCTHAIMRANKFKLYNPPSYFHIAAAEPYNSPSAPPTHGSLNQENYFGPNWRFTKCISKYNVPSGLYLGRITNETTSHHSHTCTRMFHFKLNITSNKIFRLRQTQFSYYVMGIIIIHFWQSILLL